ncbi:hypothetical protein ACQKPE_01145 [Pseudomonas sp. NPDC089554]|uniref:hypothetical protein n=1 Tax=Pseudomonas sp. NPDC089554 TaxID=3390653 RepID=UPI003CFFACCB
MSEQVEERADKSAPIFFSNLIQQLQVAEEKLKASLGDGTDEKKRKLREFTLVSLGYFWKFSDSADKLSLYCIEVYGGEFKNALQIFCTDNASDAQTLEQLAVHCYLFVTEIQICAPYGTPATLRGWSDALDDTYFKDFTCQLMYRNARQSLIIGIIRSYLHHKDMVTLAELPRTISQGVVFKENLDQVLGKKHQEVTQLKEQLDKYEKSFNFLGLNRAFRVMRTQKIKEARNTLVFLVCLGVIMSVPLGLKVVAGLFSSDSSANTQVTVATTLAGPAATPPAAPNASATALTTNEAAPSTTKPIDTATKAKDVEDSTAKYLKQILPLLAFFGFELVMLYFFKVVLHSYRSVKAQLLQIDLRIALTQFVMKYSEYARDAKGTNNSTLERFEQVIFSGIVGGDSEIPSTFDGLDQVVKVLEKVRPS